MDSKRDDDPLDPADFFLAHARYLRRQDDQFADLRQGYESYSPEERAKMRQALETAEAANNELAELGIRLKVEIEHDECDDAGNTVRWADCEFSVCSMLLAIRAWDAGEDFTPDTVLP